MKEARATSPLYVVSTVGGTGGFFREGVTSEVWDLTRVSPLPSPKR